MSDFVYAPLIVVTQWHQRVKPEPGTKIGRRGEGWETYRPEADYDATATYIGYDLAALNQ